MGSKVVDFLVTKMDQFDVLFRILYYLDPSSLLLLKLVSQHHRSIIDNQILHSFSPCTLPIHLGRMISSNFNRDCMNLMNSPGSSSQLIEFSPSIGLLFHKTGWLLTSKTNAVFVSDSIGAKTNHDQDVNIIERFEKDRYFYLELHHNSLICLITFEKNNMGVRWDVSHNHCFWFAQNVLGWNLPHHFSNCEFTWLFDDFVIFCKVFENQFSCSIVYKNGTIIDSSTIWIRNERAFTKNFLPNFKCIRDIQNHSDSPCYLVNQLGQHCLFFYKSKKLWMLDSNSLLSIVKSPLCGTFDMFPFVLDTHKDCLFWINDHGELYYSRMPELGHFEKDLYFINSYVLYSPRIGRFIHFSLPERSKCSLNYYGLSLQMISIE